MSDTNMQWTISDCINVITPIVDKQLSSTSTSLRKIIHLTGSPGIGKTTVIRKTCKDVWNAESMIIKFPSLSIEELSGIPDPTTITFQDKWIKAVEWAIADILRVMFELYETNPDNRLVVVLDDCHFCPDELHAYMMSLLDYELKGFKIPSNVAFIVITNDSNIAGAIPFPSPVMSRMITFDVTTNSTDWLTIMSGQLHPVISAFLSIDTNKGFLITEESRSTAYACPRSWHNLSDSLKTFDDTETNITDMSTYMRIVYAHIGPDVSVKFTEFALLFLKFDMKPIFDTGKYEFPKEDIEKYPFILAAANYFVSDETMYTCRAKLMGKMLNELFDVNKIFITITLAFIRDNDSSRGITAITKLLDEIDSDKHELIYDVISK